MSIEYKTEGRLELKGSGRSTDTAVITWVKGDDKILLLQGSTGKIVLSKQQILEIAKRAEVIADDLQPNMNSLPRAA